ncbi:MAG: hypothetical protein ACJ72I_08855 [Pseudonocardiaceae bacterium]
MVRRCSRRMPYEGQLRGRGSPGSPGSPRSTTRPVFTADTAWLGSRIWRPQRDTVAVTVGRDGLLRGRFHVVTHVLAGLTMVSMFAVLPGRRAVRIGAVPHLSLQRFRCGVCRRRVAGGYGLGHELWCGIRVVVSAPQQGPGTPGGVWHPVESGLSWGLGDRAAGADRGHRDVLRVDDDALSDGPTWMPDRRCARGQPRRFPPSVCH